MVSQLGSPAEESSRSRESILDAAAQAFTKKGFSGARVDAVARAGGVNKAMIYYHFGSKQGLYRAVLLRLFSNVLDEVERLRAADLSPEEKLGALYGRITRHFADRPALPQIMLREILAGGEAMDAEASHTLGVVLGFVADTIQAGVRTGALRDVHPFLLHITIMGPLLLHFAGRTFRERVLPREAPQLQPPMDEDVLAHLLEVLDRTLAPATRTLHANSPRNTK